MQEPSYITHTLDMFINNDSRYLILGSLPSVKSRELGFYYMHPQNRFYKVLSIIFNDDYPLTIDERKTFLKKHHIALYDVIEECSIIGSSDASIKDVIPMDIESTLKKYPNIKVIGINGKKACSLFDKYLKDKINNKDIRIVYLPSTSPANARIDIDSLVGIYQTIL